MNLNIDLAETRERAYGLSDPAMNDKVYPYFNYRGDKDLKLPDTGEMTIRYKVCRITKETDNDDNAPKFDIKIDILKIVSVEGKGTEAPAKSGSEAADALDAIAAALNKAHEESEGDDEDDEEGEE